VQTNLYNILELQPDETIVGVCCNQEKKYGIVATSRNNLIMVKGDKIVGRFQL
jgi:hypothetical protein